MAPSGVFLSYSSGLASSGLVEAARAAIADSGGVALETEASSDLSPTEQCRRLIRDSAAYVGVLGTAYGPELADVPLSYAEFEYRTAVEVGVPRLVYLLPDDLPPDDPGSDRRQRAFRDFVAATATTTVLRSARDLALQLPAALDALVDRSGGRARRALSVLHCGGARERAESVAAELGVPARPVADPGVRSFVDDAESALILHDGGPLTPPESFGVGYAFGRLGRRALAVSTGPVALLANLGIAVQPWSGEPLEAVRLARSVLGHPVETLPECFISYAPADTPFVRRLRGDLEDAGFATWTDTWNTRPGADFSREIMAAVDRAEAVLVVLSHDAARSPWVRREVARATAGPVPRPLVPVLVDADARHGWDADLLGDRQPVDFTRWTDETEYRRALRQLVRGLAIRTGAAR